MGHLTRKRINENQDEKSYNKLNYIRHCPLHTRFGILTPITTQYRYGMGLPTWKNRITSSALVPWRRFSIKEGGWGSNRVFSLSLRVGKKVYSINENHSEMLLACQSKVSDRFYRFSFPKSNATVLSQSFMPFLNLNSMIESPSVLSLARKEASIYFLGALPFAIIGIEVEAFIKSLSICLLALSE